MNRHKQSIVTLAYQWGVRILFLIFSAFLMLSTFFKSFHVLNIALKRVGFLLNLPATDRGQNEPWKFINVWCCCIDFPTLLAGKILLSFSVFQCLRSHHCSMNYHVLINMALSEIPYCSKRDFLQRWNIGKSNIYPFFQWHKLLHTFISLGANQFCLDSDVTLLEELEELFWKVMELWTFERKVIHEFK